MKLVAFILLFFAVVPIIMRCNFNAGNAMLLFLATISYSLNIVSVSWIRNILIFSLGAFLLLFIIASIFMICACYKSPEGNETLIVLGCGLYGKRPSLALLERMDAAISYMKVHSKVLCIVSGGQGSGEDTSEANAMYEYMIEHGISKDRLIKENQSTSTKENIEFSKILIQQKDLNTSVTIITHDFHEYRASMLVKENDLSFHSIPVHGKWYATPIYWVREVLAIWFMWLSDYLKKLMK